MPDGALFPFFNAFFPKIKPKATAVEWQEGLFHAVLAQGLFLAISFGVLTVERNDSLACWTGLVPSAIGCTVL